MDEPSKELGSPGREEKCQKRKERKEKSCMKTQKHIMQSHSVPFLPLGVFFFLLEQVNTHICPASHPAFWIQAPFSKQGHAV